MQLFLVSVLLVVATATVAQGGLIKCYSCVYPTEKDCEHPSSTTTVVNCTGSCTLAFQSNKGDTTTVRSCLPIHGDDECKDTTRGDVKSNVCVCNSDLCNGASFQSVSTVAIIAWILCATGAALWH